MRRIIIVLLLIFVCTPLLIPFLRTGYFESHDGEWAVIRAVEMHRELRDLQIPPRWAGFLNHGYGYPLFLFTYPFPYYLTEVFHLIGFGFVDSVKLVFILSIVGSAYGMYLLASRWWGTNGGIVSTIFYLYAPFRLTDLYIRGSIGESLGFVFFPLLFYFGENSFSKDDWRSRVIFCVLLAALMLTHNVFALLFLPVLFLYLLILILGEKKSAFIKIGLVVTLMLIGSGIASYFWLPAFVEQKFTLLSTGILNDVVDRFTPINQLFTITSQRSQFARQIGIIHIVGFVLGIFTVLRFPGLREKKKSMVLFGVLAGVIVYLMTPGALWFWSGVPIFSAVDFTWRYLGPLSFILSLGAGALALRFNQIFVILILAVTMINIPLVSPTVLVNRGDAFYETNDATTTAFDELMPIWIKEKARNFYTSKIKIIDGKGTFVILENRSQHLRFDADMEKDSSVEVNSIYFPGWKTFIDGKESTISLHPAFGTVEFVIPKGTHEVSLQFTNTSIRTIGELGSLVSFAGLLFMTIATAKKRK